ncbi:hypothetical protein CAEBREN_11516 [Caenorhabditis brenneri]|uniref:BTB domain-containing protein n=1 Tax=Caenorhabditis brenneri TaxID=135651 RepID=G0N3T0_CAEBE|nr:hypothetical protein CAEBREN_11516 [Caenorhabditis brenneri]
MLSLEKQFTISHTIDLSSVTQERKCTEEEMHYSIPWCMVYYNSNNDFAFGVSCLYTGSKNWEIDTKLKFKLKFSERTTQTKYEKTFGSTVTSLGWRRSVDMEDLKTFSAENGKFTIQAKVVIKKMSGFGKEMMKSFDEHSQKHWDVILNVDGQKFHLLKAYLASQSSYFDILLFGSFKEASQEEVELKEVDHEDFQSFLELIHGESSVDKMSRLEKKFTLSHTIDLSNVTSAPKSTAVKTHFSIPWCLVYYKSNNHFTFGISCLYTESEKWGIDTKLEFRINSSDYITRLECERTFGNTATCWVWLRCVELEDLKNFYAENEKLMIEAHLTVKKMSGFEKEKLKSFDESSQNHWDVIISVDSHKFYLVKAFLAFQSTYFDKLLFGSFKETSQTEVELKEVDRDDFQSFLELIHGEPAVDDTNIDGVLHLADMFDAPTAIRRCEEFLLLLSKWSLDEKIQLAERYHLKDLKINLQQVPKEDQKKELEDVVPKPAEQSPEATWFSWIRTVPVLFYLNCFLFVSILFFAIIISLC